MRYDMVYTTNKTYSMPECELLIPMPHYVYVPLRGYSSLLAVFDFGDECIGWIATDTLGYPDVKAWMHGTNWIDGGY